MAFLDFGGPREAPGLVSGGSWASLAGPWGILGVLSAPLGAVFGAPGASWGSVGYSLRGPWGPRGSLGVPGRTMECPSWSLALLGNS